MHGKPRNRAAGVEGSTGESPPSGRYASASKQETAPAPSVPKAETPHRAGATRPRRGRPPKITRDQIVDAVLSHGFAGITIPEVAQRLGVTTMTVYRHAATRAELLGMAWERVLHEHAWPDRNLPWRDLLDEYATAVWDLLAEHPGAATELYTAALPARMADLYVDLASILAGQGFTVPDAVLAVDTVIDLAVDHRHGVENLMQTAEDGRDTALRDRILVRWAPPDSSEGQAEPQRQQSDQSGVSPRHTDFSEPPTDSPNCRDAFSRAVRAELGMATRMHPRDWFGRKLALVLDGIATLRED